MESFRSTFEIKSYVSLLYTISCSSESDISFSLFSAFETSVRFFSWLLCGPSLRRLSGMLAGSFCLCKPSRGSVIFSIVAIAYLGGGDLVLHLWLNCIIFCFVWSENLGRWINIFSTVQTVWLTELMLVALLLLF